MDLSLFIGETFQVVSVLFSQLGKAGTGHEEEVNNDNHYQPISTNENQWQPIITKKKQIKESYFHFAQDRDPVNFGLVEKWRKIERPLSASTKVLFQSEIEI